MFKLAKFINKKIGFLNWRQARHDKYLPSTSTDKGEIFLRHNPEYIPESKRQKTRVDPAQIMQNLNIVVLDEHDPSESLERLYDEPEEWDE